MSKIGKNIKKIRATKGLSQTEFGKIFGITRGSIGSYEEGRAEPKIDTLLQIANKFSISIDDITTKDVTVNLLSGFNPDNISKNRTTIKTTDKPLISTSDLINSGGKYENCQILSVFSFPLSRNKVCFAVETDANIEILGANAKFGTVIFCGNPHQKFDNEFGRLQISTKKLIWDLENKHIDTVSFPVYGIISDDFKRAKSILETKVKLIEYRLDAIENQTSSK